MSQYVPCPKCATPDPQQAKFTWWGGMLGPKLLSHVRCVRCGNAYNGKSGNSNTPGIIIYSLVTFGIVFMILFGMGLLSFLIR